MLMMPTLPYVEAKELFTQELANLHGKLNIDVKLEELVKCGYFRAKVKNMTLFTDVGLIDGQFKVFTFVDGVCKRISSYQENNVYDFSLIESKVKNCKEMISSLESLIGQDLANAIWEKVSPTQ